MKIWIINQNNSLPEDGHFNRHFNFAKQLKEMGHEPTLFFGSNPHNTNLQLVNSGKYVLNNKYGFNTFYVKTNVYNGSMKKRIVAMWQFVHNCKKLAMKYAKETGVPDVILGSSSHPFNVTLAIKLAEKFKCKSICEVRDLWPESIVSYNIASANNPLVKWLYKVEKKMYAKADKIVFTMAGGSQYIKDKKLDLEQGGPVDLSKVYNINNGVNLKQFNIDKEANKFADADLDNDETFKFIYTGSLRHANKNIWKLLEAAKLMQGEKYQNVKFLIYGKGDQKDKFEEYIKDNNIKNVVLKEYVPKNQVPYVLSKCDVNILNCDANEIFKYGGSQNKLFDYLASGKPILEGEESEFSVVNLHNCGVSKKLNNSTELKELFDYFINMPENEYQRLCENCLETAKLFDFKVLAQKLVDIIEKN